MNKFSLEAKKGVNQITDFDFIKIEQDLEKDLNKTTEEITSQQQNAYHEKQHKSLRQNWFN